MTTTQMLPEQQAIASGDVDIPTFLSGPYAPARPPPDSGHFGTGKAISNNDRFRKASNASFNNLFTIKVDMDRKNIQPKVSPGLGKKICILVFDVEF